jgi:hypothetical protein
MGRWPLPLHTQVTNGQPILDYDGPGRRAIAKTGDIKGGGGGWVGGWVGGRELRGER